jgi:hypothetical protein
MSADTLLTLDVRGERRLTREPASDLRLYK